MTFKYTYILFNLLKNGKKGNIKITLIKIKIIKNIMPKGIKAK